MFESIAGSRHSEGPARDLWTALLPCSALRIGTWTARAVDATLLILDCDVLLLTEVSERLAARLPSTDHVWGGDFTHAMTGREWAGSIIGRASITSALDTLGLTVPTTDLPGQIATLLSIDHDAYVVTVA